MSIKSPRLTQTNEPSAPDPSTLDTDKGPGTEPRLLYSYAEARRLIGNVPQSTFALWIADGLVTPVRIGPRRCFIKREDLMRLQAEGTPEVPKALSGPRKADLPKAG